MSRKTVDESKKILEAIKNRHRLRTWGDVSSKLGVKLGTLGSWRSKGGLDEDVVYKACPDINLEFLKSLQGEAFNETVHDLIFNSGNDTIVGRDDHRPTVVNGNGHHVDIHHGTVRENIENVYSTPDQRGYIKAVVEELWELPKAEQREILRMILNRESKEW